MEKDTVLIVLVEDDADVAALYPQSGGRLQVEYIIADGNAFALADKCRQLGWSSYRYRLLAGCGAVCDKLLRMLPDKKFGCTAAFMQAPCFSCYNDWGKDEYEALVSADPVLTFSCAVGDIPSGDVIREFCFRASELEMDLRIIWNDGDAVYPPEHRQLVEDFVAESIRIADLSTGGRVN